VSLGKTVVSGGVYGNKEEGISGSIHWNSTLRMKAQLQKQVFTKVASVVKEAFGKQSWFKNWMRFFKKERPDLKKYLIPGIPCTSIWWSYDDRPYNLHFDWNTYGAAFLFCAEERDGGNVVVLNPEGELDLAASIHLDEGKMLCGRWARSDHCNEPVLDGKKRFSFVAYFDSRIETGNYLECFESHPTEEIVRNLAIHSEMLHSEMQQATRGKTQRATSTETQQVLQQAPGETQQVASLNGNRVIRTDRDRLVSAAAIRQRARLAPRKTCH
jgi:hypothetical protein